VTLRLELPEQAVDELVERAARRAAELVLERLDRSGAGHASPYLSVEEAAELLRAKPQRIYDMRSAGRLTRFGDGSRALISRAEIEAHLAGGTNGRVAPALPIGPRGHTAGRVPQ
jgi:excisionase family DNA binding protein